MLPTHVNFKIYLKLLIYSANSVSQWLTLKTKKPRSRLIRLNTRTGFSTCNVEEL